MCDPRDCLTTLLLWGPRQWLTAVVAGLATGLVVAVSTALIPTPVFGRSIAPESWAWPVVIATSVLTGLLVGTYVRDPRLDPAPAPAAVGALVSADGATPSALRPDAARPDDESLDRPGRLALAGGALAWFAVGCPVCNKLVLLALGASGAVTWFAPVQPYLAALSIGLLAWALRTRLLGAGACALPATRD